MDRLLAALRAWQAFYGPVETFDHGIRGMVQLDNGSAEYAARADVIVVAREALNAPVRRSLPDEHEDDWVVRELTRLRETEK